MKTDFKRFRRLRKMALVLLIPAVAGFVCTIIALAGFGWKAAAPGILCMFFFGLPAFFCECAAYDCVDIVAADSLAYEKFGGDCVEF